MGSPPARKPERFLLWIDAVGGYWVCLSDQVILGQPAGGIEVDIPILGDISKRHARICRDGEGYLVEALRPVWVNEQPVHGVASLTDGSVLRLGESVRLVFRRPHALSATARLEFASGHRTEPSSDGVLLMADTCVLGPNRHSHVVCRDWPHEVVIYVQGKELYCRSAGGLEVDGLPVRRRSLIGGGSRVVGHRLSFSLEEV